jgi:adenylate kinase family enzyme
MRTVIIGNSGSGKTWLSHQLADERRVAVISLDNIFWNPGGFDVRRATTDVIELVGGHLQQTNWVVEGVFGDLAELFLEASDELVWLDLPWPLCHARLLARGSEGKRNMNREQTAAGLDKLLSWAEGYYTRNGTCSREGHKFLFSKFLKAKHCLLTEQDVVEYLMRLNTA